MGLIVKRVRYDFEEADGHVVLEKWSAIKMLTVIRDMGEIVETATEGLGDQANMATFIAKILRSIGESEQQFTALICNSVVEPKNVQPQDVLEWEAVDYLGALEKIFEINLTPKLQKKFQGLLRRMMFQQPEETEGAVEGGKKSQKQGKSAKKD